ncbi:transposase InsO family protein [Neomicrococcus lactis]|uniref:Transposase InsO family protein n=1 Tax=Neomicrococcus lactis TaxID=732241 RepID=A0A7W8YAR1_9MICC|nr:transposase InsO family protein [Neomicrococcus lactis]
MKLAQVRGVQRGRRTITTTTSAATLDNRPDLVKRDFTALGPHRLWVADVMYVQTLAGFAYTAFVTDVFTRKIVGWSVSSSLTTASLPLQALEHALVNTGAHRRGDGQLIHHSDRGTQYVSVTYSEALAQHQVSAPVGTVPDSYDNALAETVNGLYKTEIIHARIYGHQRRSSKSRPWTGWSVSDCPSFESQSGPDSQCPITSEL